MSPGTIVLIVLCVLMAAGLVAQGTILTKKIHKLEEEQLQDIESLILDL